jgi:hypothetical protein
MDFADEKNMAFPRCPLCHRYSSMASWKFHLFKFPSWMMARMFVPRKKTTTHFVPPFMVDFSIYGGFPPFMVDLQLPG